LRIQDSRDHDTERLTMALRRGRIAVTVRDAVYRRRMSGSPKGRESRSRMISAARKLRFWRRDDSGGTAGVREPRRPKPKSGAGAAAIGTEK